MVNTNGSSDNVIVCDQLATGALGVMHLKRLWSSAMAQRCGHGFPRTHEKATDQMVLNALGLGLQQTIQYLFAAAPTFETFEQWIIEVAGRPAPITIERLNAQISKTDYSSAVKHSLSEIEHAEPVLSEAELAHWQQQGYVVLKGAVSEQDCARAEQAIWDFVAASPDDPETWYSTEANGIMVELIQQVALEKNRHSARIHKAFSQLWGTTDLWATADRCGFHPPQKEQFCFPGPDLHWDVDFSRPLTFGTQGVLYLTDTPAEQGALTLVPGFHHKLSDWLAELPEKVDPQKQDLHALGSKPIGASAGDMVIWHQFLPHGSRPNLGKRPRIVQYINMLPGVIG